MPQIIRTILRQANVVYNLANATSRYTTVKPTLGAGGDYSLKIDDIGKFINVHPVGVTGNLVYLPNSVFSEGHTLKIFNPSPTANLRIAPNTDVILHTPGGMVSSSSPANTIIGTGYRNVAPLGIATIVCVAANTFVIYGPGVNVDLG